MNKINIIDIFIGFLNSNSTFANCFQPSVEIQLDSLAPAVAIETSHLEATEVNPVKFGVPRIPLLQVCKYSD